MLFRHEAEPGGELTAIGKVGGIFGRGNGGAEGDRANADDGADSLGIEARFRADVDFTLAFLDALIESVDLLLCLSDDRLEPLGHGRA